MTNHEPHDPLRDVFRQHDPPPGGLEDLRDRLEDGQRLRWGMVAAPIVVATALLLLLVPWQMRALVYVVVPTSQPVERTPSSPHPIMSHPSLIGMGLVERSTEPVSTPAVVGSQQASAPVLHTDQVAVYWVGSVGQQTLPESNTR